MPHDTAVPTDLLDELRTIHRRDPSLLDGKLPDLRFHPLAGGRNNRVYAWDSPDGEVYLKLYLAAGRLDVHAAAVAVTSVGAHRAHRYHVGYDAAKADVESVVRTLALEYGLRLSVQAFALSGTLGNLRPGHPRRPDVPAGGSARVDQRTEHLTC